MKYLIEGYYEKIFRGLAESEETDDFSKVEDIAHEYCFRGLYVRVTNQETGKSREFDPDYWMECIDFGEVPSEIKEVL